MEIKELIPKHKDDQKVIDDLKKLSFEQLKPIIPDLLEWLQDMNWPIGGPIADILKPFADKMIPEIIEILRTNDDGWQWSVLANFARNTTDPLLLREIERIAKFPSSTEVDDEVNLEAIAILNGDYK
jgi:hypothetical protein